MEAPLEACESPRDASSPAGAVPAPASQLGDGGPPRLHACKRCGRVLDLGHFRSPGRGFWTCRPCEYRQSVAHRRADPGCRLARRLRVRGHTVGAAEVRAILELGDAMDKASRDEVSIVQQSRHEPLWPNNWRIVPRAARAVKTITL